MVPVPVVIPVPASGPALPVSVVTPVTPKVPPTEAFVAYVLLVVTAPDLAAIVMSEKPFSERTAPLKVVLAILNSPYES
jgi:hypothetical protein